MPVGTRLHSSMAGESCARPGRARSGRSVVIAAFNWPVNHGPPGTSPGRGQQTLQLEMALGRSLHNATIATKLDYSTAVSDEQWQDAGWHERAAHGLTPGGTPALRNEPCHRHGK